MNSRALREGIKLRNILGSVRINELGHHEASFNSQKLLIQRHLGLKEIIPFAGLWKVYRSAKDECWFCNQSIMTVFLWRPRVGQLISLKDTETVKHYEKILKKEEEHFVTKPHFMDGHPWIFGSFTGWRPCKMRNVYDFLLEKDRYKPDFT